MNLLSNNTKNNLNVSYLTNFKAIIQETYFKNEYIEAVNYLQKQIIEGNIYEINFCNKIFNY